MAIWRKYLLKTADGSSVAFFRIIFGLMLFWEVIRYFQNGWIERYYISPGFYFTYPGFSFIQPWAGNGMYWHFALMGLLALFIALGLFYRLVIPLFFLMFTYIFLLDETNYLNHFYLISLLSFMLCFIPAHHAFSLDHWLFFRQQPETVPYWAVFWLRGQLFLVYFFGGIAKLNGDWLQGEPMRLWLGERTDFPLIGTLFTEEWIVYLFAYGGLLFDLAIGFLLWWWRTRPFAFLWMCAFHLLNSWLLSIGIFPWLMIGATLIFAEPDWPKQVWARVRHKRKGESDEKGEERETRGMGILYFILLYLLVQILLPLRHWLYPGDVSWTEEGHRFAWHMKLRTKEAEIRFYVTDPRNGDTWPISPGTDLSSRQLDEMMTRPYMIVQYAHHLADRLQQPGQPRPIITAKVEASLNGRSPQPLIDPTINLAEVDLNWRPAHWILPLTTPLKDGN